MQRRKPAEKVARVLGLRARTSTPVDPLDLRGVVEPAVRDGASARRHEPTALPPPRDVRDLLPSALPTGAIPVKQLAASLMARLKREPAKSKASARARLIVESEAHEQGLLGAGSLRAALDALELGVQHGDTARIEGAQSAVFTHLASIPSDQVVSTLLELDARGMTLLERLTALASDFPSNGHASGLALHVLERMRGHLVDLGPALGGDTERQLLEAVARASRIARANDSPLRERLTAVVFAHVLAINPETAREGPIAQIPSLLHSGLVLEPGEEVFRMLLGSAFDQGSLGMLQGLSRLDPGFVKTAQLREMQRSPLAHRAISAARLNPRTWPLVSFVAAEARGSVHARDAQGNTALHVLAATPDVPRQVALDVLAAGARVDARGAHELLPLTVAIAHGNGPLIEALAAAGAHVNRFGLLDGLSVADYHPADELGVWVRLEDHLAKLGIARPRTSELALRRMLTQHRVGLLSRPELTEKLTAWFGQVVDPEAAKDWARREVAQALGRERSEVGHGAASGPELIVDNLHRLRDHVAALSRPLAGALGGVADQVRQVVRGALIPPDAERTLLVAIPLAWGRSVRRDAALSLAPEDAAHVAPLRAAAEAGSVREITGALCAVVGAIRQRSETGDEVTARVEAVLAAAHPERLEAAVTLALELTPDSAMIGEEAHALTTAYLGLGALHERPAS